MLRTMSKRALPNFWHDPALPYLEARSIDDGRGVCYGKHAHETFSIGLVTGGRSDYLNGRRRQQVQQGTVVLMNPGDVHACNPLGDEPWSYRMFYVDARWLGRVQHELGSHAGTDFHPYAATSSDSVSLYAGLESLYATCVDPTVERLAKESAAVGFFTAMHRALLPLPSRLPSPNRQLQRAADFIREHCAHPLKLDDICTAADLSPSYLIRAFKARFGMTPHAYLVNRRIEYCRGLLRQGVPIADAALQSGFADQAHMQRTFKLHVAATPGQYRSTVNHTPAAMRRSPPAAAPWPG